MRLACDAFRFGPLDSAGRVTARERVLASFVSLINRSGGVRAPDEVLVGVQIVRGTNAAGQPPTIAVRVRTADDPTLADLQ
jgi:hypothetical protein